MSQTENFLLFMDNMEPRRPAKMSFGSVGLGMLEQLHVESNNES